MTIPYKNLSVLKQNILTEIISPFPAIMYAANEFDSGWVILQCGLFFLPNAALFFFSIFYTVTVTTYSETIAKLLYSFSQYHIICCKSSAGCMLKNPTANLLKPVSFHLKSVAKSDYGFYLLSELLND